MSNISPNIETFKCFGIAFFAILLISSINSIESLLSSIGFYLVIVWISWQMTKLYQNYNNNIESVDPDCKAVLITGCDTGFGNLLAQQLDSKGFTVFASCLDSESKGAQNLLNTCSKRLKVLKLDVTKDEDMKEGLDFVKNNLHNNKLWALVNNAGILHYLPIEWGAEGIDIFKKQMDVNAMGQVRVTKAFLPLLRNIKNSRIVNVESLAGRLAMPGISSYSMSKFAVRAFSESLRNEVKQFDINVSVIEPTVYSTGLTDYNLWIDDFQTKWKETPEDVRKDYGPEKCDVLHERINAVMATAKDNPQEVVDAMLDSVTNTKPKPYYYVYSLLERALMTVLEVLPTEFYDLCLNEKIYFTLTKFFRNKNRI